MNEYKNFIRRKKRQLNNLYETLNFLKLNPKYNNGSNDRAIDRLTQEIEALNELYSENSEKEL